MTQRHAGSRDLHAEYNTYQTCVQVSVMSGICGFPNLFYRALPLNVVCPPSSKSCTVGAGLVPGWLPRSWGQSWWTGAELNGRRAELHRRTGWSGEESVVHAVPTAQTGDRDVPDFDLFQDAHRLLFPASSPYLPASLSLGWRTGGAHLCLGLCLGLPWLPEPDSAATSWKKKTHSPAGLLLTAAAGGGWQGPGSESMSASLSCLVGAAEVTCCISCSGQMAIPPAATSEIRAKLGVGRVPEKQIPGKAGWAIPAPQSWFCFCLFTRS